MFRVIVSGKFEGLSEEQRAVVLGASGVGFTPSGVFTHDGTVSAFTFRCQVVAEEEPEAIGLALEALGAYGLPYHVLRTAATDMRHIKIRRR